MRKASNVPNVWRKENLKILPLFHCLNAPCWMNVGCTFLIPPGHLLTTSTTRSRAWRQFDATLARSKQHRRPRCRAPASPMLSWSKSLEPGHQRQSSCTDVVLLPLVLSGSSEDSAESEEANALLFKVGPTTMMTLPTNVTPRKINT